MFIVERSLFLSSLKQTSVYEDCYHVSFLVYIHPGSLTVCLLKIVLLIFLHLVGFCRSSLESLYLFEWNALNCIVMKLEENLFRNSLLQLATKWEKNIYFLVFSINVSQKYGLTGLSFSLCFILHSPFQTIKISLYLGDYSWVIIKKKCMMLIWR